MQASHLLAIAVAGSLGAVARHLLVIAVLGVWPGSQWAIALVNLVGCLGFGVCFGLATGRWSPIVASAVLVGFFGAFTTFSSFAFECQEMIGARQWAALLGNVLVQNVVGIAALAGGIAFGRTWAGATGG